MGRPFAAIATRVGDDVAERVGVDPPELLLVDRVDKCGAGGGGGWASWAAISSKSVGVTRNGDKRGTGGNGGVGDCGGFVEGGVDRKSNSDKMDDDPDRGGAATGDMSSTDTFVPRRAR